MISKGSLLIDICSRAPWLTRPLLRCAYQLGAVPDRVNWVGLSLREKLCESGGVRTIHIDRGIRMRVDLASIIGRTLYFDGSYEPGIAQFLSRTLQPGWVVIDGGANVGELSLRMAQLVGPRGNVFSVEPSPTTFAALADNIELNASKNIVAIRAGIARAAGTTQFHLRADVHSLASSIYSPSDAKAEPIDIELISIDQLVDEHRLDRVNLIKLDVEGAELEALAGARKTLSTSNKPTLIVEYNYQVASHAGWRLADLRTMLHEFGYSLSVIDQGGRLAPLTAQVIADCDDTLKIDLAAVPPES